MIGEAFTILALLVFWFMSEQWCTKIKNKIALSFINLTKCLIYEVRIHIIYTLHVRGVQKLELEQPQLRHLSNKD